MADDPSILCFRPSSRPRSHTVLIPSPLQPVNTSPGPAVLQPVAADLALTPFFHGETTPSSPIPVVRLKIHLWDPSQVTKSPMRPTKRGSQLNGSGKEDNLVSVSASSRSEDFNCQCSLENHDLDKHNLVDYKDVY